MTGESPEATSSGVTTLRFPARRVTRPSREQVAAFVRLGRPLFLLNSLVLVTFGTSVAVYEGHQLDWGGWALAQLFAWSTRLVTHYCNEYFDLEADRLNADHTDLTGGSRVLVAGTLQPQVALSAAMVLLFGDLVLVVVMPGSLTRLLALASVALLWFYTAPPFRLNYRALGEPTCALALNVTWPLLAYLLQAPGAPGVLLWLVAVSFIMQTARMTVMNLADHDSDRLAGKRTLANTAGPRQAVRIYSVLQAAAYGMVAGLVAAGVIPWLPGVLVLATGVLAVGTAALLRRSVAGDHAAMSAATWWASTQISGVVWAATLGLVIASATRASGQTAGIALTVSALAAFTTLFAVFQVGPRMRNSKAREDP